MIYHGIFTVLKQKLQEIEPLKNIDWYLDQEKKKGGIIQTPCIFIEFEDAKPIQVTKYHQEVEVEFKLKLYTDFKKSPEEIDKPDNIHFIIEQEVFLAMNEYEQIEIEPAQKDNHLLMSSQSFKHKFLNCIPQNATNNTIQSANISPEINTNLDVST